MGTIEPFSSFNLQITGILSSDSNAWIIVIVGIILLNLIVFITIKAIDLWWLTRQSATAVVTGLYATPAYSMPEVSIISSQDGDASPIQSTRHVPPSWQVGLRLYGQTYGLTVDKAQYEQLQEGQSVTVQFVVGRIFHGRRIISLSQ